MTDNEAEEIRKKTRSGGRVCVRKIVKRVCPEGSSKKFKGVWVSISTEVGPRK